MTTAPREEDRRLIIPSAATVVGPALGLLASSVHVLPHAVLSHLPLLIPIALGAVAIATAPATQRIRQTRRLLASRRAVVIVPGDGLAPSPGTVAAFASSLAADALGYQEAVDARIREGLEDRYGGRLAKDERRSIRFGGSR